ncbi:uncharacterized protein LOC129220841 [Uloborus diversus]|uniref:uncharacterized protein LOC129220841 n=1 Tax=Uloborus diversus TaxID=327109 RepID=UPI002409185B|nr:uncharacterized protein LOC129220841 [Uloborus diversus]
MRVDFLTVLFLWFAVGVSLSCDLLSLPALEKATYALAHQRGISPVTLILRMLRRARSKQKMEKMKLKEILEELAVEELMHKVIKPETSSHEMEFSVPRPANIPGVIPHMVPSMGSHQMLRPTSLFFPLQNLPPPPGLTVRVSGFPQGPLPEVSVTLSPLMTLVEALRQAEEQFRSALRTTSSVPGEADDIIHFGHSGTQTDCYIIQSLAGLRSNAKGSKWNIIVSDKLGEVIYNSHCLPNPRDVKFKPGMTITLLYSSI